MKSWKKSSIFAVAMMLILSMALTACGGKGADSGGKTLIWGRGADAKALDPALVTDGESFKITKNVMETLVDYKKGSTEVEPALAESWETSKDGKTWTFKLRKGVKFHDGTDFNADAVVFNVERWMDPKHPQHKGGEFIYYPSMFGGFKGDKGHVIESVKAVDPHTVEFKLKEPQGPFLANIGMVPFAISSPKALKEDTEGFSKKPVGTGPFKFISWKKNDAITLEKNEDYWDKGKPKVDKVIFKSIPDNTARYTAFQSGDIDVMDGMNPGDAKSIKKSNDLELHEQEGMNIGYLAFNMSIKGPLKEKKVRQALNHAVNKKAIIKSVFSDMAVPAVNPMPSSMWGYNDKVEDYEYDLDKAKKLLKEAGYEDGFEIDFWAMPEPRPYMPDGRKVAEYIQADFAKIGVKTKIVSYDWQTYLDKTQKGEHSMALLGWNGDNGDPDNFLYVLLDKDNAKAPAQNIAFYKSDKLHDLLIRAQRDTEVEKRTKLYEEAQEIIKEDAPWVPLVHATQGVATRADIEGGNFDHPINWYEVKDVEIKN